MKPILKAFLAVATLLSHGAYAQDIFIGTLSTDGKHAILKRCDLGQTEYLLMDRNTEQSAPLAKFMNDHGNEDGFWYAEVFGIYEAKDERHGLRVIDIQNLQIGKSCHLLDALKDLDAQRR